MLLFTVTVIILGYSLHISLKSNMSELVEERLYDQVTMTKGIIKELRERKYQDEEIQKIIRKSIYRDEKEYPENLKYKIAGKGFLYIFDNTGKLIVHPAFEGKNMIEESKVFRDIFEKKEGIIKYISPKTGTFKIAAIQTIEDNG